MSELTRRNFCKGALAGGGLAALAGLAGCAPASTGVADKAQTTADAANAGGRSWESSPEPITDISEERDFDVVVVGAGVAGMAAAEAAARSGARVVVIERSGQVNARGVDMGNVGSKVQKEAGVEIDPYEATRLLTMWSQQVVNRDLIFTWASRSSAVFDYIAELAQKYGYRLMQADGSSGTAKFGWDELPERWRVLPTAASLVGDDGISDNVHLGEILQKSAEEHGAELVFNTRAEQLVGDASAGVSGVIAITSEGKYVQYNAAKGVVLATGDIGGNEEMVSAFAPLALRADMNAYTPEGCNTGDGILMGLRIGAALSRAQAAPMIHQFAFSNYDFPLTSFYMSWLSVDREGNRYGAEAPFEPYVTNARMVTPGNVAWSVFDSDYLTYVKMQMPDTYDWFSEWVTAVFDEFVGGEFLTKANTLEELADTLGMPADNLAKTVERYNAMFEKGHDDDFGVPAQHLTQVKNGPFYATPNLCSLLVIPFGLHVDANSQVLTDEDEPIPGLFAVGNMQGDFFAFNYPVHCPGVSHGRCLTFGQLVGEALAQGKVISETA